MLLKLVAEGCFSAIAASFNNSFKGRVLSNYKFIHSHESDGIQLSDVVIGLVAKIVNFCNQRTESELISFRRSLGRAECRILDLVEELITRSDNRCRAYFHNVTPLSHMGIYGSLFQKSRWTQGVAS